MKQINGKTFQFTRLKIFDTGDLALLTKDGQLLCMYSVRHGVWLIAEPIEPVAPRVMEWWVLDGQPVTVQADNDVGWKLVDGAAGSKVMGAWGDGVLLEVLKVTTQYENGYASETA